MHFKIIITGLLAIALTGCSNGDPKDYIGHWKDAKYSNIVLEISDQGNDHYLIKKLDLKEGGGPQRKTMASMKDGELLIGGNESVPILKDGSMLFFRDEYVRQKDAEVAKMKQSPRWLRYNKS